MTPKISLVAVCCSNDFLEFLEQPHVLDRDDGLIGEGLKQFDLFIRERANVGSAHSDDPMGISLSEQRRDKALSELPRVERRRFLEIQLLASSWRSCTCTVCSIKKSLRPETLPGIVDRTPGRATFPNDATNRDCVTFD